MPQYQITNNSDTVKELKLNGQVYTYPPFAQNTYTLDSKPTVPSYFTVIEIGGTTTPPTPPVITTPPTPVVFNPLTVPLNNVSSYDAFHNLSYNPLVLLIDSTGTPVETDYAYAPSHVYLFFPQPFTGTLSLT